MVHQVARVGEHSRDDLACIQNTATTHSNDHIATKVLSSLDTGLHGADMRLTFDLEALIL